VAAQRTEEVLGLFIPESEEDVRDPLHPRVRLTRHYEHGRDLASRRVLKRWAFIGVAALLCGVTAFIMVGLAHYLVDGKWLFYKPGNISRREIARRAALAYILLGGVAAGLTALLTIVSRPEQARGAKGYLEELIEAAREAVLVGVILVIVAFFWRPALISHSSFSRGTILLFIPLTTVALGVVRCVIRASLLSIRRHGHNVATVVVIGDGPSANSFMKILDQPGLGYRVIAHVTDTEVQHDLGGVLERISSEVPVDEVVIASFSMAPEQLAAIVSHPGTRGARLRAVPEMFGLPPSKVQIQSFGDFPLLTLFENPVRGPHWAVKRALDVIGAGAILAVAAIPMAIISLLVRFTSEGPILFRQERVGMDGKRFDLLKFRSMTAGASDQVHRDFMAQMLSGRVTSEGGSGSFFKLTNDARITPVGKFLRRYSLDELPQLINVIRGEMSLVGPRPALAYEVDLYEDWQRRRLDVLPGMTGLWQVSGRSRLSPADMLRLDVHYAETWSLSKDFVIILKTIPAILHDNAR
jgi:exopolysaccharide biosynthesis polyprenyl glycosylphosphotransferase